MEKSNIEKVRIRKITRGMRNNNPFNIRKSSNNWYGKIPGKDKEFEVFDTAVHGYRAGLVLLRTYYIKYRCDTIRKVIERFAPSSENNTVAYIDWLSRCTGFDADAELTKRQLLGKVAPYIAIYETNMELPLFVRKQIIYNLLKEYE